MTRMSDEQWHEKIEVADQLFSQLMNAYRKSPAEELKLEAAEKKRKAKLREDFLKRKRAGKVRSIYTQPPQDYLLPWINREQE